MKRFFLLLMIMMATATAWSQSAHTGNVNQSQVPVLFDGVRAYTSDNGVQLEWANLTERDLLKYEVERSETGTAYGPIDMQLPKRNLDDKVSYNYFDAGPRQGSNFYRIKVYVKSGKIIYSKVMKINISVSGKKGLSLYPNPVVDRKLTVGLTGVTKGAYNLRVINTAGQDVFRAPISAQGTGITQMIELPASLKPGGYIAVVTGDEYLESKMFIIQ